VIVESLELSPICISHLALFVARVLLHFANKQKNERKTDTTSFHLINFTMCLSYPGVQEVQ